MILKSGRSSFELFSILVGTYKGSFDTQIMSELYEKVIEMGQIRYLVEKESLYLKRRKRVYICRVVIHTHDCWDSP